jgi:hypothetical protein
MQGVERETAGAWLSVGWQNGTPDPDDQSFERGAAIAGVLARTLRAAGYEPRRLQLALRRGAQGVLELHVLGDVPGMPLSDFESLARVTLNAVTLRRELAGDEDLVLLVHLEPNAGRLAPPLSAAQRRRAVRLLEGLPIARVGVGVVLGLLLGVLGLPRFELALPTLGGASEPNTVAQLSVVEQLPTAVPALTTRPPSILPTPVPTLEEIVRTLTPTQAPVLTAARYGPGVLFAERFVTPLLEWPNDPHATAWFEDGAYRLFAREPGRFVAVGVPLPEQLGDGAISAQFHKVGGPSGGGYGFIIRDQGRTSDRDSRSQAGRYIVLEVGDKGEVGVWQRNETRWVDIVSWHHADAVRPGDEPNLLVVYTRGPAIRFEVNGEVVADVAFDGLPTRGGVGIFVGGDLNEAALEWLRIEAL